MPRGRLRAQAEDNQVDSSLVRKIKNRLVDRPELSSEGPIVRRVALRMLPEILLKLTFPLIGDRVAGAFGDVDHSQTSTVAMCCSQLRKSRSATSVAIATASSSASVKPSEDDTCVR